MLKLSKIQEITSLTRKLAVIVLMSLMFMISCASLSSLMVDEEELNTILDAVRTDTKLFNPAVNRGSRGFVSDDVEKAFLAKDIDSLCDGLKMLIHRNFNGLKRLEQEKKIFWFGKETMVVVISLNRWKRWVRIQNGPHEGEVGWVFYPLIKSDPYDRIPIYPHKDMNFRTIDQI